MAAKIRVVALGDAGTDLDRFVERIGETEPVATSCIFEHWIPTPIAEGEPGEGKRKQEGTQPEKSREGADPESVVRTLPLAYRATIPLEVWFKEGRGFPSGLSTVQTPLRPEWTDYSPYEESGLQVPVSDVVLRPEDWAAVSLLPSMIQILEEKEGPSNIRVWLFPPSGKLESLGENPDRTSRFAKAYMGLREILWALGEPWASPVTWFVLGEPTSVTGLPVEWESLMDILGGILEVGFSQASDLTATDNPVQTERAYPHVFHAVGEAHLDRNPAALIQYVRLRGAAWLSVGLPGRAAGQASSEAESLWEPIWGMRADSFRKMPTWYDRLDRMELYLTDRVWSGGGWNAEIEQAVKAPLRTWLMETAMSAAPEPGEGEGEEETEGLLDAWEKSGHALAELARSFLEDADNVLAQNPWPGPLEAIQTESEAFGPFLELKIEELRSRLRLAGEGDIPEPDELGKEAKGEAQSILEREDDREQDSIKSLEDTWYHLVRKLEAPMRRHFLDAARERLERTLACWESLQKVKELANDAPESISIAPSDKENLIDVVLRLDIGVEDWSGAWRRAMDELQAGGHEDPVQALDSVLSPVEQLTVAEWNTRLQCARTLFQLRRDGRWEPSYWRYLGTIETFDDVPPVLRMSYDRAGEELAEENVRNFSRMLELRVHPAAGRALSKRVAFCSYDDEVLPPDLLRSVLPASIDAMSTERDTLSGPSLNPPIRLARAFAWSNAVGLNSFDVFQEAARAWERSEGAGRAMAGAQKERVVWNPGANSHRGGEVLPLLRRVGSVIKDLLVARSIGSLRWDTNGCIQWLREEDSSGRKREGSTGLNHQKERIEGIVALSLEKRLPWSFFGRNDDFEGLSDPKRLDGLRTLWEEVPPDLRRPLPFIAGGPSLIRRFLRDRQRSLGLGSDPETAVNEGWKILEDLIRPPKVAPWKQVLDRSLSS